MIPNSFAYYQAESSEEAYEQYQKLVFEGKKVFYYAGGSEIITMARVGSRKCDAVIDLKKIPECQGYQIEGNLLRMGACLTLTRIREEELYPCLAATVGRIADHTNQNRITIGGNLCGTIIYHEAILPLLLAEAKLVIYGKDGRKEVNVLDVFHERIKLEEGEFLEQILVDINQMDIPYFHIKKTKNEKIDYPLLTIVATHQENDFRMAFSGLCNYPLRSLEVENILNNKTIPKQQKVEQVVEALSKITFSNLDATKEYRLFVLQNTVKKILDQVE